jgi:enamine deaminase RidA (YjgF/YER057c/UK114 family)
MVEGIDARLQKFGIQLPVPPAPIANYVGTVIYKNSIIVSGQLCFGPDGKLVAKGKLGRDVAIPDGQQAARAAAINVLAQVKATIGDLNKIVRVIRLGGFINAESDFFDLAQVMNGASDLMVAVFDDAGRHARSTIGVSTLPLNAAVEVEGQFLID